jgi:regulator of protease activity HflC (stomatin/prohibitin superfamily)
MTDTPKKLIVDIAKGTHEYIDLTPAEIAERDQMAAEAAERAAEREAEEAAKADAKLNAQAKLQALGLTGDEIAAITE